MMSKLSILIADDDEAVRELLQDYFLSFGHVVAAVADGFKAVKAAGEMNFQIAFIDDQLNGPPALEVAQEIKRMQPRMTILIMSERLDQSKQDEIGRGSFDIIEKPFSLEDIKELLIKLTL